MNAQPPLLALEGVSKRFGAVQALDGVDFEVDAGEVVGLVGDNGAGKSTLVKIISGSYSADDGELYADGTPTKATTEPWTPPMSVHTPTAIAIATSPGY